MKVLIIIIAALFLFNCNNNFWGLTYTDEDCNVIAKDNDDWSEEFGPACPNPVKLGEFTEIWFNIKQESNFKIAFVDHHETELASVVRNNFAGHGTIGWDGRKNNGEYVKPGLYQARMWLNGKPVCRGDIEVIK